MRRVWIKDNKWKVLFFGLLAVNLLAVSILFYWMTRPIKDEKSIKALDNGEETVEIPFTSNKKDLNRIINHYIEEESLNGPIDYEVLLKNEVELYGTITMFGKELQMKMTFKPVALKNGNLLLKQKSLQLGEINLPVSYALNYINEKYKTPKWISIRPSQKNIYVALNKMDLKSGITVKAKKFDLNKDDIELNLLVPVE